MSRDELREFIELAIELGADNDMPLTEALFLAADLWDDLRASFGPVLTIEPISSGGLILAA